MLVKSDSILSKSGTDLNLFNDKRDKLQERLKKEKEEEKKSIKLRQQQQQQQDQQYITKHTDSSKERRLSRGTAHLDITEIRPYLYLCGAMALRGNALEHLKVTCVINATTELPDTPLPSSLQDEILYLRVNVDDKSDSDILSWLDIVSDIINQIKLSGGKTLIHCVAGVSRSATLCLAYLMKYEGYSLHDSYVMLKSLREIIRPNSGFFGQLVEFEQRVTGKKTVLMIHSDYTKTCIPHIYEEDYQKLHIFKCRQM